MIEFLKKNKKALGAALALTGLASGGLIVADKVELSEGQTEGLVGAVLLMGGLVLAFGKAFLAKRAEGAAKDPPKA